MKSKILLPLIQGEFYKLDSSVIIIHSYFDYTSADSEKMPATNFPSIRDIGFQKWAG